MDLEARITLNLRATSMAPPMARQAGRVFEGASTGLPIWRYCCPSSLRTRCVIPMWVVTIRLQSSCFYSDVLRVEVKDAGVGFAPPIRLAPKNGLSAVGACCWLTGFLIVGGCRWSRRTWSGPSSTARPKHLGISSTNRIRRPKRCARRAWAIRSHAEAIAVTTRADTNVAVSMRLSDVPPADGVRHHDVLADRARLSFCMAGRITGGAGVP